MPRFAMTTAAREMTVQRISLGFYPAKSWGGDFPALMARFSGYTVRVLAQSAILRDLSHLNWEDVTR